MKPNSAANNDQSSLQTDLGRYKQAAELAYQYVKNKSEESSKQTPSPFDEEKEKEPTQEKETT